jgi:TolB protein
MCARLPGSLIAALVAFGLGPATASDAANEARNGRIAFLRTFEDTRDHLIAVPPRGGPEQDLTPAGFHMISFAWSSSGRKIVFSARAPRDLDPEIFVMNASGSGVRQLTRNHFSDRYPAWSPDGRKIAFASIRTGMPEIYSMRADGTRQRRLTRLNENCEWPSWSPTGRLIVFTCPSLDLNQKLWVMRPDGSRVRPVTKQHALTEITPAWSPDGRRIVFTRGDWRQPAAMGVYTIRPDGRDLRRVGGSGFEPGYSPDGRSIVFAGPASDQRDIYAMRADGTRLARITDTPGIQERLPRWQPRQ